MGLDKGDLPIPQTKLKTLTGELPWDIGKSLLVNAEAKGGPIDIAVAKVASSWVPEYVKPEKIEPPYLKENPKLQNEEEQQAEVGKAMALVAESLRAFVSNNSQFHLVGGLAFPMDAVVQSGIKPADFIRDKNLLGYLAHFIKESGSCFSRVKEEQFVGANKEQVVATFDETYKNLVDTWDLKEVLSGRVIEGRIKWAKR